MNEKTTRRLTEVADGVIRPLNQTEQKSVVSLLKDAAKQQQEQAAQVDRSLSVRVINGTGISGYAATKQSVLNQAGYANVAAANPSGTLPDATVVWYQNDADKATAEDVEQRHGQLLAAAPEAEAQFTLLFDTGGTHITPESEAELERLLSLAQERPGADILIIGHTDRVGSDALNDELSLSRSRFVREMLIQRGFDARRIEAAGRGSRDPVVPTAAGVAEPRNRRTEVLVR